LYKGMEIRKVLYDKMSQAGMYTVSACTRGVTMTGGSPGIGKDRTRVACNETHCVTHASRKHLMRSLKILRCTIYDAIVHVDHDIDCDH
jgi:hypothetical protein